MGKQQRAGAAERQLIGGLLPVTAEQELAIQQRNFRIVTKDLLVQRHAGRAAVPHLFPDATQVRIGTVEVDKRQVPANIPRRFTVFWHQAKTVWPTAIFPAMRRFLIAFITVGHVQA